MRLCLIYDCLYPYTVGGAERWYRNLAEQCVAAGHEVTYLTRRQWPVGEAPELPGATVVAVSGQDKLYTGDGRRRIGPPLARQEASPTAMASTASTSIAPAIRAVSSRKDSV